MSVFSTEAFALVNFNVHTRVFQIYGRGQSGDSAAQNFYSFHSYQIMETDLRKMRARKYQIPDLKYAPGQVS